MPEYIQAGVPKFKKKLLKGPYEVLFLIDE